LTQGVGKDLVVARYVGAVIPEVEGIVDITIDWTFNFVDYFTTNAVIGARERATLGGVTTVPTEVTAYP
jgi:hypothetical protein